MKSTLKLTFGTFGKGKKARTQELDAQSDILVEPKQKFPSRAERPNHEGWGPTRKCPTAAAEPYFDRVRNSWVPFRNVALPAF